MGVMTQSGWSTSPGQSVSSLGPGEIDRHGPAAPVKGSREGGKENRHWRRVKVD